MIGFQKLLKNELKSTQLQYTVRSTTYKRINAICILKTTNESYNHETKKYSTDIREHCFLFSFAFVFNRPVN